MLDPPSRGQVNCSGMHGNFTYNSTCTFSCEDGFVRMGAEMLWCAATGNWTRQPPVCAGTVGPPSLLALEGRSSFLQHILNAVGGTPAAWVL